MVEHRKRAPMPTESANIFEKTFFWWVFPFFLKGYRKELEEEDLYDCAFEDTSEYLGDSLQKEWKKELIKAKEGKKPSLKKAVIRTFGVSFVLISILCLIEECFIRVVQPICLGLAVRHFSTPDQITAAEAYWAAAGVCASGFLYIVTHHPFFFGMMRAGMKLRIASCILVYKKALRLSRSSLGKTTVGQMVNLLSNDVNRFDQSVIFLPYLVVGPLQTGIAVAVLWKHLGVASIAGLLVLFLCIPLQSGMGKIFSKLRGKTASLTDERVRLMNEIIAGMRVIKMYTWEKPFADLVAFARKKEVAKIRKTSMLRGINIAVFFAASKLIVFICFLTHVLMGEVLTAEKVFVSMTLYNNLRLTMTLFFPFAIAQWAESGISLARIQKFLLLEEQGETSEVNEVDLKVSPDKCGIWVAGINARWNNDSEDANLKDLSFSILPGDLLAVVGPVGSGKTSLLMSLLGELPTFSGEVKIRGRVAYASQEPWVFAGSVRENVTFGKTFEEKKYGKVLKACALDKDIEQFPYGDRTLVGERGVSLSGGQKARVNLARALYLDADVYLLDDPLSAVDIAVAKHLFDKCINGYLKDKARILVTHQVQFLKAASNILVLKEGASLGLGSYEDLARGGLDVMSLMEADEEEQRKKRLSMSSSFHRGSLVGSLGGGGHAAAVAAVAASVDQVPSSPSAHQDKPFFYESMTSLASSSVEEDMMLSSTVSGVIVASGELEVPKQEEETRTSGAVSSRLYWDYIRAGSGCALFFLLVVTNLVCQAVYSGSDYWLSMWTNYEEAKERNARERNETLSNATFEDAFEKLPEWYVTHVGPNLNVNLLTYTGMAVGLFALSLLRTTIFFIICMRASVLLHNRMFTSITRVPIDFFDNNPVGRILNRFTKDMGQIDDMLPLTYFDLLTILLSLLGIVALVVSVSLWVTLPTVILTIVFFYLRKFYICTARDVKRLEGTTRSPVFSHLATSLYGLTTIRAFKAQAKFGRDFCYYQDRHTSSWFMFMSTTRWFGVVLDLLTASYISIVVVFLLVIDSGATGGNVGLAISSALLLSGMFQWGVRQSAELESQMTSVERVMEYSKLPWEAALDSLPDKRPPPDWPQKGGITFEGLTLRYLPDKPPVLKNLHCRIRPQEKIGIVGRTGAGKSSVLAALFRMSEPEGAIYIDGVKTSDLGLHDLRSKISIIPQDPVLFTGPVRRNIDPFGECSDADLWGVLKEVQLKEVVEDLPGALDTPLSEGGSNFSVGQRQLICLARAILRKNKILVLDEATANVDHRTDALIQRTIREKFVYCTVLTIAHRLNTIMDSDRVLVLEAGQILEYDEPYTLLRDSSSSFHEMVQQTGKAMARQLFEVAQQAHRKRSKMGPASRSVSDVRTKWPGPPDYKDEVTKSAVDVRPSSTTLPEQDDVQRIPNGDHALARSESQLEMTVRL